MAEVEEAPAAHAGGEKGKDVKNPLNEDDRGRRRDRSRSRDRSRRRDGDRDRDRRRRDDDDDDRGRRSRRRERDSSDSSRSRSRERRRRKKKEKKKRRKRDKDAKSKWDDMGAVSAMVGGGMPGAMGGFGAVPGMNPLAQMQMQQMMGLLPAQQAGSKKQRELYVGNLTPGLVTHHMLTKAFTDIFQKIPAYDMKVKGPPILNVDLNSQGKFAFLEFRDEEAAATAMKFSGLVLAGQRLKIGRPSGYVQPPIPPQGLLFDPAEVGLGAGVMNMNPMMAMGGVAGNNPEWQRVQNKKQRELYVGNLATGRVSAEMLRELFTTPMMSLPNVDPKAGPVVMNVDVSNTGQFAFVEFSTEELATTALSIFNGMEVCGRAMRVGRPSGYVAPNGTVNQPPANNGQMGMMGIMGMGAMGATGTNMMPLGVGMAQAAQAPAGPPPTTFLCLTNLVGDPASLQDETEYREICEDIREECAKTGTVVAVKIPRATDPGVLPANVGKAFVQFGDAASAQRASQALHGRKFDSNIVQASFVPSMPA